MQKSRRVWGIFGGDRRFCESREPGCCLEFVGRSQIVLFRLTPINQCNDFVSDRYRSQQISDGTPIELSGRCFTVKTVTFYSEQSPVTSHQ
ncbi:hypothetical protein CKA32_004828 [Geitlerinema sp. FC II]|nr:hypothetical protein CKA32_004828 [Geitlerinema sp. FC II]